MLQVVPSCTPIRRAVDQKLGKLASSGDVAGLKAVLGMGDLNADVVDAVSGERYFINKYRHMHSL